MLRNVNGAYKVHVYQADRIESSTGANPSEHCGGPSKWRVLRSEGPNTEAIEGPSCWGLGDGMFRSHQLGGLGSAVSSPRGVSGKALHATWPFRTFYRLYTN